MSAQSAEVTRALKLVAKGMTAYAAAKKTGIALSTIYRAIARNKARRRLTQPAVTVAYRTDGHWRNADVRSLSRPKVGLLEIGYGIGAAIPMVDDDGRVRLRIAIGDDAPRDIIGLPKETRRDGETSTIVYYLC